MNLDFWILDGIQGLRTEWLDVFFRAVTRLGDGGIFWLVTALVLCVYRKYRPYGLMVLAALFGGLLIGNLGIKPFIARLRPFQVREGIVLLIREPGEFSFPSGHTLSSFEAAFVLFYMDRRIGAGALFLASLIAFSRLYLFVHYPTDVLGGFLLACVIAGAVVWAARRFFAVRPLREKDA
ncbi:MAG: phosphatase PAP2 family protein [Lachnospiraceae bacterium]|nr:phosphatase PAP2 family protein [Lachnospiraceae bacterium]